VGYHSARQLPLLAHAPPYSMFAFAALTGPAPEPAGETRLPEPLVRASRCGVPLRKATAVARAPTQGFPAGQGPGAAEARAGPAPKPSGRLCQTAYGHWSDPTDPTDSSDGAPSLPLRFRPVRPHSAFSPRDTGKLRPRPAFGGILHSQARPAPDPRRGGALPWPPRGGLVARCTASEGDCRCWRVHATRPAMGSSALPHRR
jgi:hypothetical protein